MSKLERDNEERLIIRSQQGDLQAFNQLVLQYQQAVYTSVFRMLGNSEVAADVTQDTFLAALKAIKSYRGGSSFRAWLMRISTNLAYDYWRRVRRHPEDSLDVLPDEDSSGASTGDILTDTSIAINPEERLLKQELQQVMQNCIQRLPLDQRTALILCDIQGLSYEEIALATQSSLGTVRSRISRGRARMRLLLSDYQELLPRDYRLSRRSTTD